MFVLPMSLIPQYPKLKRSNKAAITSHEHRQWIKYVFNFMLRCVATDQVLGSISIGLLRTTALKMAVLVDSVIRNNVENNNGRWKRALSRLKFEQERERQQAERKYASKKQFYKKTLKRGSHMELNCVLFFVHFLIFTAQHNIVLHEVLNK